MYHSNNHGIFSNDDILSKHIGITFTNTFLLYVYYMVVFKGYGEGGEE